MKGGGEWGTVQAWITGWGRGSKRNTEKERFSVGLKVQGRRNESEGEVEDPEHGSGVAALTKGFGCHSRGQRR